jgi:3-oxoacyl-[acyl-carrier-protein] synthase III
MTAQPLIIGIGHYLPERIVRNEDLPAPMNADPAGITKRTGIVERRWIEGKIRTSDLAAEACKKALADARLEPGDIDCIIAATLSNDYVFPGLGVYTQPKIGMATIPAYDVRNQCSGFLYSLNMAKAFIMSGMYKRILVACAEVHSRGLGKTMKHAHITPLFGDGAAAIVVSAEPHPERTRPTFSIDVLNVFSDGKHADRLRQRIYDVGIDPFIDWKQVTDDPEEFWYAEMDGQFIFRKAVDGMSKAGRAALTQANLTLDDIAWILPHQANLNISKTVCSMMKVPPEKMLSNIHRVGNTTAASIPLLLSETIDEGKIKKGDRILTMAFGSGLTWGAGILTAH